MSKIDLRSDTVTQPTKAMLKAMFNARVGDDVIGEDPSVQTLEALAAEMTGCEAALFTPSATQANLIALMCHCERGDEYIVAQHAHCYRWEGGGAAVLGSIQPQPIDAEKDGTLDLQKVKRNIKADDPHFAKTKLLCLENTYHGKVLPLNYLEKAYQFAKSENLALHIDGARAFNAAVSLNVPISEIAKHSDSITLCLCKGLGAPVGAVLCGNKNFINKARRWRKVLGGGMRQAGYMAAAGHYALRNHVERLKNDHNNAAKLFKGLEALPFIKVRSFNTNMIFFELVDQNQKEAFANHLKEAGIVVYDDYPIRMVLHLGISEQDIVKVITKIAEFQPESVKTLGLLD